ncbi:MAG: hypothetical protein H7301_15255 [Cryobacterium sp.]|nr:hypothetical protein [Oligoflexia bacterium]
MKRCAFCGHETTEHICPKCGGPQPVDPSENYFSLLGVERAFQQDLPSLEKKFYDISRTLHPDRFAAGTDSKWKVISVERMSAVNKAYQTLTKRDSLRRYLLELEGVSLGRKEKAEGDSSNPVMPMELAEEWFDLQDAVMENPESALARISAFERGIRERSDELKSRVSFLENEYDANASREALLKIDKLVLDGQYLKSMDRDLIRLKSRLGI